MDAGRCTNDTTAHPSCAHSEALLAACSGVGLGQAQDNRDFSGMVAWESVQLRAHLGGAPRDAGAITTRQQSAQALIADVLTPKELPPVAEQPSTWLERMQERGGVVQRRAPSTAAPMVPHAGRQDAVTEAPAGTGDKAPEVGQRQGWLQRLNFRRWRSKQLLAPIY